ncbi:hypothetical protein EXV95_05130 [Acidovorax sp. JMULE5]|nr:hypothetical protein EXV95_05130 [Acidovorax sp. JMULE5]
MHKALTAIKNIAF